MPIDDVNYLYEHSAKDSFMMFIDSATRDRTFYPDPNEYVITFEEPLKFVYGLDILDATIPNTMYNIDAHNNHASLMVLKSNADETNDKLGFNARLPRLVLEQQGNELFKSKFTSGADFDIFIVNWIDWDTHPELQQFIDSPVGSRPDIPPPTSVFSMILLVTRFQGVQLTKVSSVPPSVQQSFLADPAVTTFASLGETYLIRRDEEAAVWLREHPGVSAIHVRFNEQQGGWEVTLSQNVLVPSTHGGAGFALSQTTLGENRIPFNELSQRSFYLEIGQYDINTLQEELQANLEQFGMYVVGTDRNESSDLTKQGRALFLNTDSPFMLNMDASSIYENLGFDPYAVDGAAGYTRVPFLQTLRLFASVYNESADRFQLRAPGNINLLGMRYVRLRCKEIEDHLSSNVTFNKFTAGIGLFKLQDIRDVTNLRFDYSTFLRKPFHPIGKLTRLTLKFETPTGYKYDFKGFNHHILISIKYLSPNMTATFKQSTLNPNYDPDYIRYVTNLAQIAQLDDAYKEFADEDGDEDEESENEDESDDW